MLRRRCWQGLKYVSDFPNTPSIKKQNKNKNKQLAILSLYSKNDNTALRLLGKTSKEKVKNSTKIKYLYN